MAPGSPSQGCSSHIDYHLIHEKDLAISLVLPRFDLTFSVLSCLDSAFGGNMNHIRNFQSIPHNLSRPELRGSLLVFSQEGLEVAQLEEHLEIDQVCSTFELKTVVLR